MLYSYKTQYPKPIPFRIVLSNGRTRTDPSSFTAEEIADAGYVPVANPPSITEYQKLSWSGTNWVVTDFTQEEIAAIEEQKRQEKIKQYDDALTNHLDSVAQQYRYDNRITFALRAGYSGPYQQEGIAFAQWMDTCNYQSYQLMQDVLDGKVPEPTLEEFLQSLPIFQPPT